VSAVHVDCDKLGDRYRCAVVVGDDAAATRHHVAFDASQLARPATADTAPEELIRAAFDYLLDHEPREQILREFELDVIGRYFPDWEGAVRAQLAGR
jgi:hypothetical protein